MKGLKGYKLPIINHISYWEEKYSIGKIVDNAVITVLHMVIYLWQMVTVLILVSILKKH